jgi:hypothetical protein
MALKPFKLGIKAKMYFGEAGKSGVPTDELSNVTDVTITLDASEAEVTTRDNDGFRATIAGLKDVRLNSTCCIYRTMPDSRQFVPHGLSRVKFTLPH